MRGEVLGLGVAKTRLLIKARVCSREYSVMRSAPRRFASSCRPSQASCRACPRVPAVDTSSSIRIDRHSVWPARRRGDHTKNVSVDFETITLPLHSSGDPKDLRARPDLLARGIPYQLTSMSAVNMENKSSLHLPKSRANNGMAQR